MRIAILGTGNAGCALAAKFTQQGHIVSLIINIAEKVPYAHLISLDMYLNNFDQWKCLEINLFGQTIRFSQYAGTPFFGSLTQEVVNKLLVEEEKK